MPIDVATGSVQLTSRDLALAGKVELIWDRRFSTSALARPPGLFGSGWSSRYSATLQLADGGYVFSPPHGNAEFVEDRVGRVAAGDRAAGVGASLEIFRQERHFIVQQWDVETALVTRYRFDPPSTARPSPLRAWEDAAGCGLDLTWSSLGRLEEVAQRLERRALAILYTAHGLPAQVVLRKRDGGASLVARYEYDAEWRLTAVLDAAGRATRYAYDDCGRVIREILPDGGVFSYAYDKRGRCIRTSGLDRYDQKTLRYLDAARVTEATDSLGQVRRYQWLPSGQVTTSIDPEGGTETTEYDAHGRIVAKCSPVGGVTRYEYDEQGNRSRITDPLGHVREISYNRDHLPIRFDDANGQTWRRTYDEANRLVRVDDPSGAAYTLTYIDNGALRSVTSPSGNQKHYEFAFADGRVTLSDWSGNRTQYDVDDYGRVVRRIQPSGGELRVAYDAVGQVSAIRFPDGGECAFSYDAGGNITQVTNPKGEITRYVYGSCRRLLEKTDPLGQTVRFVWATEPNRLLRIINELGKTHEYEYDGRGHVILEVLFDGQVKSYRYDAAGRCIWIRLVDGAETQFIRDANGNIVEQILGDGSRCAYQYDASGKLIVASNRHGSVTLVRDAVGRVVQESTEEASVETTFDVEGQIRRLVSSAGCATTYEYDANGLLSLLEQGDDRITFQRDGLGLETSRSIFDRLELKTERDRAGRITSGELAQRDSGMPSQFNGTRRWPFAQRYRYDGSGLLVSVADRDQGETRFEYDALERLVRISSPSAIESCEYDACGNITEISHQGSGTEPPRSEAITYAPGNVVTQAGDVRFIHDKRGRLVRRVREGEGEPYEEWQYDWDELNQLVGVRTPAGEEWSYAYDALGRRIRKEGPGTCVRYVWNRNTVLHEVSEKEPNTTWLFAPDSFMPIATVQSGRTYAVICDRIGAPQMLVDTLGTVAWSGVMTAWGTVNERVHGSAVRCDIRLPGQWRDSESRLHYNYYRYYDPTIRRFISPDPVGIAAGFNGYSYPLNPLDVGDPFGLNSQDLTGSNLFRGDDNYDGGPMGRPLGSDADIKEPWDHVRRESNESSIFTSWATTKTSADKFGDNVYKVKVSDIQALEAAGQIRVLTPDDVHAMMSNHPDPKVQRDANNVRDIMQKNNEVLVEGEIPEELIKKCK